LDEIFDTQSWARLQALGELLPHLLALGQPVAKRIGAAACPFTGNLTKLDAAAQPAPQRDSVRLRLSGGPFGQDVFTGQLLGGVFQDQLQRRPAGFKATVDGA
jgi:hypothetical protein